MFWNEAFLPNIGGVEIFTKRLAEGLIQRGHEIAVIAGAHTDGLPDSEQTEGVQVHRFRFLEAINGSRQKGHAALENLMELLQTVADIKRRFRPDVVHVNLAGANSYFHLRTLKAHPTSTVVTFQAALNDRFKTSDGLLAQVISQAARVVAVSCAAAENISTFTGYPRCKIDIVTPGIPPDHFIQCQASDASGIPIIVFLGRLAKEKGADIAVEAVERLNGAARLRIIGDGPQRKNLEDMVHSRSLAQLVSFEGRVDDETRKRLLAESSIMVVPSRHEELFGMVAVEGALSGLPVVASAVGGLSEIVVDRGLLCPPGDAKALAKSLEVLIKDRLFAARLGQAARAHALANHTVDRMIDAYERLYTECALPTGNSRVSRSVG